MTDQQMPFEERKWRHELEIEERKWKFEKNREDAQRAHDNSNDFHTYTNKAALDAANLALRTLVLINGGAAVAILAFLGAIASKDKIDLEQVSHVANTLRFYAVGVAFGVAAMALAYLTNYFMASVENAKDRMWEHPFVRDNEKSRQMMRVNRVFHVLSFLLAFTSLSLFIVGMWTTSNKVTHLIQSRSVSRPAP
jgi:hypothetical protein